MVFDATWNYPRLETVEVSFTGNIEADGNININDLTAVTITDTFAPSVNSYLLSNIVGFGTYNTLTQIWTPNGFLYQGAPNIAYITWTVSGGVASLQTNNPPSLSLISVTPTAVPIPPTVIMFILGLLGIGALRKKFKS